MSLPFQPRSRAAGTPTTGGRFPPPSALSSAPRARRGFTPRSAAKTKVVCGASNVKPKLTAQQQLDIIHRLEAGNFQKGVGLSQFYEEYSNNGAAKLPCKQNLFSSFASEDHPIACSTRNYGNGMYGSMESLISIGTSILSSSTAVEGIDVTSLEVPVPTGQIPDTEEYNSLPDYIKLLDKILLERESYCRRLEELADIRCATKFEELLPQEKMVSFFKSLDRVQKIIHKFLRGNATENMKLFMPTQPTKGPPPPVIHCDVEHHSKIINSFYRLSEIMTKLESYIKQDSADFKLEAKIDSFKDIVNSLEEAIKNQEQLSQEVKDMEKKTETLYLEDETFDESETTLFEESPSP